jgi:penicillin G amidase
LLQRLGDEWLTTALGPELAALVPDHTQQVDQLVLDAAAREALGVAQPLAEAVALALADVEAELGPLPWRYDAVHRIVDPHPLAKAVPALFSRPPTPVGGSRHSVCLMAPNAQGEVIEGAPWRFVAELTPTGTHVWDVLRHGSSGHPLSPHYDDQTPAHTNGELRRSTLTAPAGGRTLVLTPHHSP